LIRDVAGASYTDLRNETNKTAEVAKAIDPVKAAEAKKTAAAVAKLDCKRFFPSVGLTLTVPCE
jgi:hypothetical protein